MIDGSFDWRSYLSRPDFVAAPVSCFNHVTLSRNLESLTNGILVEARSIDCTSKCCASAIPCCYWIASVLKVSGYFGLMRYEGCDAESNLDFWVNFCCPDSHIHTIGWCAENGMPLVPLKCIEDKFADWKEYLMRRISRVRTIPADFLSKVEEHKQNLFKKGMKLEVVDKNLISAVRVATVKEVIGGRLHVKYDEAESDDEGFWCHERSPLVHPIGWAQIIGHALKGKPEYARQSLLKTLYRTYEPNDATWDMFPPMPSPMKGFKFKEGMKLEAIDPLNLSTICVATVMEVLRNNYIMIGIDGMMDSTGSDYFCYHASSPYIFPVGFCETHDLVLTPPRGFKGEFKWPDYLRKTKSKAAPPALFHREVPNHGFQECMYLEAVDLMAPQLICVASITKVVGHLLRIHFEGWDTAYDQWTDCESPDLFPVGWCEMVGYRLEPPRTEGSGEQKKNMKQPATRTRRNSGESEKEVKEPVRRRSGRRKRRLFTMRKRHSEDHDNVNNKNGAEEDAQSVVAMDDSSSTS